MRPIADTARLPSAIHATKTATIDANVNCEAPNASAPMRLKVVWSAIIAKPANSETLAQAANPRDRLGRGGCRQIEFDAPGMAVEPREYRGCDEVRASHRVDDPIETQPRDQKEAPRQRSDEGPGSVEAVH